MHGINVGVNLETHYICKQASRTNWSGQLLKELVAIACIAGGFGSMGFSAGFHGAGQGAKQKLPATQTMVAMAMTLYGFNDLGHLVTLSFLLKLRSFCLPILHTLKIESEC